MASLQIAFELIDAAGVSIGPWRDAEHGLERALKMKRALAELRSQTAQRDWLIQVTLDVAAYGFDRFRLLVAANRFRAAAQAGTVARLLGLFGFAKESNVLSPGTPRWTGRAAIDSG